MGDSGIRDGDERETRWGCGRVETKGSKDSCRCFKPNVVDAWDVCHGVNGGSDTAYCD